MLIQELPHWVAWAFAIVTLIAAVTDFRTGKIYNWLTLPALVFGFLVSVIFGSGAWTSSLLGIGLAGVLFIPFFMTGVLGGGDVKLFMALGSVAGPRGLLEIAIAALMIATAGAIALLVKHRRVTIVFKEIFYFFRSLFISSLETHWPKLSREIKAPFGVAIFVGYFCVLAKGGML